MLGHQLVYESADEASVRHGLEVRSVHIVLAPPRGWREAFGSPECNRSGRERAAFNCALCAGGHLGEEKQEDTPADVSSTRG